MRHRLALGSVVVVCVTLGMTGGCENRAERVHPPAIDASAAGRDAIAHYDANQDGAISGEELEEAPALKAALKQLDTDGNRQLIAGEITARIVQWQKSRLGLTTVRCMVRLDGKPLSDATVTLAPERFLGPNVQPATGKTDASGAASLSVASPPEPGLLGVAPGFYRVEISKKAGAMETVPAKYNTQTTLGLEVALDADALADGEATFDLTSQ